MALVEKGPETAIGVAVGFLVVQLIESNIVAPRLQGSAVKLHPAIIMIVIVGASEIAGLWGVVVGVPVTAAIRDVFLYFHREWSGARTPATTDESADPVIDSE